jgi:hypothetical protein
MLRICSIREICCRGGTKFINSPKVAADSRDGVLQKGSRVQQVWNFVLKLSNAMLRLILTVLSQSHGTLCRCLDPVQDASVLASE